VLKDFCKMRNINIDNADVEHWDDYKYSERLKEVDKQDLENKYDSIV
jgi:hypothetical protein